MAAESRTLADECLAGIERSLAARGMTSAWRLTPALQLGIVSLETKDLEPVLDVLRSSAVSRTGVSPVFRSLSEAPRALHLALVVLGSMPVGTAQVRTFGSNPLAAMLARDPDEAHRLVRQVLGELDELSVEDRTILLDTFHG